MKSENCSVASYPRCWRFGGRCEFHQFRNFFLNNLTISPRHNLTMPQSHLEGAAHLTVELVLLLCHLHVILRSRLHTEECVFTKDALVSLDFNLSVIPCICSFQWSTVTLKWWYDHKWPELPRKGQGWYSFHRDRGSWEDRLSLFDTLVLLLTNRFWGMI